MKKEFILILLLAAGLASAGVIVDTNGLILVNGSRFFPIGAYVVSWSLTPDSLIHNLRQIRDAGFNTAHVGLSNDDIRIMDSAQAFGLKIIVEGAGQAQVTRLKTHPALLAWTIQDEPELNNVTPDSLQIIQQQFKSWDPNHPTITCVTDSSKYAAYAKIPDILAIDPYLNHFMGLPVSYVGECTVKALALRKQLLVVIHAFKEGQRFPLPTGPQERSITYQAIVGGARGLNFFAFNSPPSNWFMPDSQNFFTGVKNLVAEMKTVGSICATAIVRRPLASPAAGITASYIESGGIHYIIAVSSLDNPVSGVRFLVDQDIRWAAVLFENRSVLASGGTISDDFPAYASHVYVLSTTAILMPPHKAANRVKDPSSTQSKVFFDVAGRKLKIDSRKNGLPFTRIIEDAHN